jgi:hypothetical protein
LVPSWNWLAGVHVAVVDEGRHAPFVELVAPTQWKPGRSPVPVQSVSTAHSSPHIIEPFALAQLRVRQSLLPVQQ